MTGTRKTFRDYRADALAASVIGLRRCGETAETLFHHLFVEVVVLLGGQPLLGLAKDGEGLRRIADPFQDLSQVKGEV